jgi:hypothetical protein
MAEVPLKEQGKFGFVDHVLGANFFGQEASQPGSNAVPFRDHDQPYAQPAAHLT